MPSSSWGGSEELWVATALQAISQGYKVIVSVPYDTFIHEKIKQLESSGCILELIKTKRNKNLIKKIFNKINRIRSGFSNIPQHYYEYFKKIKSHNPDCICVNQSGAFDVIHEIHHEILWIIKELRIPYFLINQFNHEHYSYKYFLIERIRILVSNATKVYFVSQRNLDVAKRQIAMREFNNYEVIKNPCKIKLSSPIKMPNLDKICFASIARLHCNTKGQDILFEILAMPKWEQRNWFLNLYGEGEDKKYLIELAEYYGINNKINFAGYVNDIEKIWQKNHILILPSIGEGTPLTLVESMYCGRTAVVTDVGDNSFLIKDNVSGFVASSPTIKLFDEAMERAWQNRTKWDLMSKNAYDFINTYIDRNAGKTLLNKIIENIH